MGLPGMFAGGRVTVFLACSTSVFPCRSDPSPGIPGVFSFLQWMSLGSGARNGRCSAEPSPSGTGLRARKANPFR